MAALTTEQTNAIRRFGFFTVERDVMAYVERTLGSRAVLMYFYLMMDARFEDGPVRLNHGGVAAMQLGDAMFSQREMAKRMECGRSTVQTLFRKLCEGGFLVRLDPSERVTGKASRRPPTLVNLPFYRADGASDPTSRDERNTKDKEAAIEELRVAI